MSKLEQKMEKDIRPPVVAILGHIDHGKSTLIDYIRKTNVTSSEAGGITQHVSAHEVTCTLKDGQSRRITLLDTPGHEAFESIRMRCANVADLAVLVVSAEDGVKPQTLEVLKYIKECGLPYLVAITKIDKPAANVLRTKQNLAENEIYIEGYGGNTPIVELSAVTGQGVDELLNMICLMAELEDKTADRDAFGSGVIIESRRDASRGITAVGIIKDGTVRRSLFAVSSDAVAPIRFLLDAEGNTVEELSFSSPVQIFGWNKMPTVGTEFKTFLKKEEALAFAADVKKEPDTKGSVQQMAGNIPFLPVVIKTDTASSLEVIISEIKRLAREKIAPKIVSAGVGEINENDVKSALASTGSIIVGFHTKADPQATTLAERSGIAILLFDIIYELTDKINQFLSEREPKVEVEEITSTSKVLKLFGMAKGKQVVGGRVLSGLLKRGAVIKIVRREAEIGRGKVRELQQSKIATDSASEGIEFGAMIESKVEVAPGDILHTVDLVTR